MVEAAVREYIKPGPKKKARRAYPVGKAHANSGTFKRGQSGNPGGRKRGPTFASVLTEMLSRRRRYKKSDGTVFESSEMELILKRALRELRTGLNFDVKLFETIMNRMEGKPKESLTLDGGLSIEHTVGEMSDEELVTIAAGYSHNHRN